MTLINSLIREVWVLAFGIWISVCDVKRREVPTAAVIQLTAGLTVWLFWQEFLSGMTLSAAFRAVAFRLLRTMAVYLILLFFAVAYETRRGTAALGGGDILMISGLSVGLSAELFLWGCLLTCFLGLSEGLWLFRREKNFPLCPAILLGFLTVYRFTG